MEEIVPYKPNRFYDRNIGERLIYDLTMKKENLSNLLNYIENGVKEMENGDLNLSNLFN